MSESTALVVTAGLSPFQHAFVTDVASPIVVFSGGLGSGKTWALCVKALLLGVMNAPCDGIIVEPTYRMIADILVPTFERLLEMLQLPYRYHRTDHVLTVGVGMRNRFRVLLRSSDRPHRMVGTNVAWGLMDEHELQSHAAWKALNARVRDKRARVPQIACSGTVEGYGWAHLHFEEKPLRGVRIYRARTRDNPYQIAGYEERLRENFTDAEQTMYLDGVRTRREGAVYGRFDRRRHVLLEQPAPGARMWIGADFNVRKMVWVFAHELAGRFHVWGELVREDTDTMAQAEEAKRILADEMTRRFGRRFSETEAARETTIVCDAAGRAASTSSKLSDVAHLIAAGFKVEHPASNPFIEDRVFALNNALKEDVLSISPAAKHLITCLEQQAYGADGKPAKASDPKQGLDHAPDALGYLVFWRRPMWRPRPNASDTRGIRHADGTWRRVG